MIKRKITRRISALSPVVGTLLVIMIVLTVTSTVMFWGLPYLSDLRAQSQQSYIGNQFHILGETFSSAITGGLGSRRENIVTIEEGTFSLEQDKSRIVVSYCLQPGYNFSVTGLDPSTPDYNSKNFTLNMHEGSANITEIFWLTTKTPYGKFNASFITPQEPVVVPSGEYTTYKIYNFSDSINNTAWMMNGSTLPLAPTSENLSLASPYSGDMYSNLSKKDKIFNLWVGGNYPNKYANLIYRFKIEQFLNSIKNVNITWVGNDSLTDGGGLYLYIWNVSSNSWDPLLGSNPVSNPGQYREFNASFSNFSYYLSNTGYVYIAVAGGFKNSPPNKPSNPSPPNGATNQPTTITLKALVTDPDGDNMTVKFYYRKSGEATWQQIGTPITNVPDNSYASIICSGLQSGTTYEWRVEVNDSFAQNISDWEFTTSSNRPPNEPTTPRSPLNGATNVPTNTLLSIYVSDPDGDPMTVKFYIKDKFSSEYTLYCSKFMSGNGSASCPCTLNCETTYYWYAYACDDKGACGPNSAVWQFQTELCSLPSCCFPAGTKITMADGSLKNIEDIKIGDKVLSYDVENKRYVTSCVSNNIIKIREGVYEINNGLISPTDDHPFYVKKRDGRFGWAAINPEKSKVAYSNREAMQLEIGDLLLTENREWVEVRSIEFKPGIIKTFTFEVDSNVHDYFANGLLVSNQEPCLTCFPPGTLITMSDLTYKPIEEISVGDRVLSYNLSTKSYCSSIVCSIEKPLRSYYIINNGLLNVTDDHPLYVKKADNRLCWAAIDASKAKDVYGIDAEKLEIGDRFLLDNNSWSEEIRSIEAVEEVVQTYTLTLEGCDTFFANHVLAYSYPKEQYKQIGHHNTLYEDYVEIKVYYNTTDNQPPETKIDDTYPSLIDGEIHSDTITIYWNGSDDQTPAEELGYLCKLYPCDSEWKWHNYTNITLSLNAPGEYIFRVRAVDKAGNVEIETPYNTLAINYTIPPQKIEFKETSGSILFEGLKENISDFVMINFYYGTTLFGRTYIFDIDSISFKLASANGLYETILENGAILYGNNGYLYLYKKPSIIDQNGLLSMHLIHTTINNYFSFGPRGKVNIQSLLTGNTFRHSGTVYNFKISFYGYTSKAWVDYITKSYNFLLVDVANNILLYNRSPAKLVLSHSILEIYPTSVG